MRGVCLMIDLVLQQLDRLQSDLLAIDPAHDLAAADRVADMAAHLRDTLNAATQDGRLTRRLTRLRRMDEAAAESAA